MATVLTFNDNEWKALRVTCDCHELTHNMELVVEKLEDDVVHSVDFMVVSPSDLPLWERLKRSVKYLFAWSELYVHDVVVSPEDAREIAKFITKHTSIKNKNSSSEDKKKSGRIRSE